MPHANGRVLAIGIGSGLNLPFYDPAKVEKLWELEPFDGIRRMAKRKAAGRCFSIELIDLPARCRKHGCIQSPTRVVRADAISISIGFAPTWAAPGEPRLITTGRPISEPLESGVPSS